MKKFILATLAAAFLAPIPALADNSFAAHESLWNSIPTVGVSTNINDPKYCESGADGADGMYDFKNLHITICQDNGRPGGPQVDWTSNDLDTLRHEAQHIIQDCAAFRLGDGALGPLFDDEDQLHSFVTSTLSTEQIQAIIKSYKKRGLSDREILLELEAFATAKDIDASMIEQKLVQFCPVVK